MNMQITMYIEKVTASVSLVIKAEYIFRINKVQMYLLCFVQNYFVVSISSSNLNPNLLYQRNFKILARQLVRRH